MALHRGCDAGRCGPSKSTRRGRDSTGNRASVARHDGRKPAGDPERPGAPEEVSAAQAPGPG